jgi:uncharacterized protein YndB with AHSA1/START domain
MMHIDIAEHIGAAERRVSSRTLDGRDVRVVTVSRNYATTPEDLWDALTKADRLPRWFLPVTGDLRPGGRYQLQGNAGGEIVVCEPPRRLKITWEFGTQVSWLEVRVARHGAGSTLTLEHTLPVDDHWKKFGPGATGVGWDLALVGLNRHVDTAESNTAEAGMQWMMSENGKSFIRQSSSAWGAAAIAAGENGDLANAAAAQTAAAFTGS